MKKLFAIAFAFLGLILTSCTKERVTGEGPVVTEDRNLGNFTGIDLRSVGDVYYKQAPNFKVEVLAQENVQDVIETFVSGGQLTVKLKNNTKLREHEPVRIMVSAPTINKIRVSGSGDVSNVGAVTSDRLDMDISGSGSISISDATTGFVDANISGSGSIALYASTGTEAKFKISGSGDIAAAELAIKKAVTTTSGSGNIRVNASENLNVTISGSGSVFYKGNPVINTSISGSGKVSHF